MGRTVPKREVKLEETARRELVLGLGHTASLSLWKDVWIVNWAARSKCCQDNIQWLQGSVVLEGHPPKRAVEKWFTGWP